MDRTPNGVWDGKLMWNQTTPLLGRARNLPNRSGDGLLAAVRDVIGGNPVLSTILEALGQDQGLAPAPVLQRRADQRSDEGVDHNRADAQREGVPT